MTDKVLDLCIVSYNVKDKMDRLLRSISKPELERVNIHIVDNNSSDGSYDFLRSVQDEYGFSLRRNPNIGYSAACNYMASLTDSALIGLLNSDIWFVDGAIDKIIESFDLHPEAAVIGPKQRDERGNITHAGIVGTNRAPKHRGWHEPDLADTEFRDFIECVTISGSAYFVRRSAWEDLAKNKTYLALYNKFAELTASILRTDPKYWTDNPGAFLSTPFYYEETAASYLLRALGYKICYDGSISIGHSWHSSHDRGSEMDKMFRLSQSMFREVCDVFNVERD